MSKSSHPYNVRNPQYCKLRIYQRNDVYWALKDAGFTMENCGWWMRKCLKEYETYLTIWLPSKKVIAYSNRREKLRIIADFFYTDISKLVEHAKRDIITFEMRGTL